MKARNYLAAAAMSVAASFASAETAEDPAAAEAAAAPSDLAVYYGASITTNYLFNGVTQSADKAAFQPWAEIDYKGFFGGFWASTVDFGGADNWEIDLYAGWRKFFQNGSFIMLRYAEYFYDDSGDCCASWTVWGGMPFGQSGFNGELWYDYSPTYKTNAYYARLNYAANDQWTLTGAFGHDEFYVTDFWDVGAKYQLTPNAALEVKYHGTSNWPDAGVVASLHFAF